MHVQPHGGRVRPASKQVYLYEVSVVSTRDETEATVKLNSEKSCLLSLARLRRPSRVVHTAQWSVLAQWHTLS